MAAVKNCGVRKIARDKKPIERERKRERERVEGIQIINVVKVGALMHIVKR